MSSPVALGTAAVAAPTVASLVAAVEASVEAPLTASVVAPSMAAVAVLFLVAVVAALPPPHVEVVLAVEAAQPPPPNSAPFHRLAGRLRMTEMEQSLKMAPFPVMAPFLMMTSLSTSRPLQHFCRQFCQLAPLQKAFASLQTL